MILMNREEWEPIYKELEGNWNTEGCTNFNSLPINAQKYIRFIEEYTGIDVKYIGIGADESKTIIK